MAVFTGTVAITGLNATDNPGPGVAVARSLRQDPEFDGRIVGLAYDALDPGLFIPGLLDSAYLLPYPSTGRAAVMERIAHVAQREGPLVLLPNLDSELPTFMGQEPTLQAMGVSAVLPRRQSFDARTKARLHELDDVPVPRAVTLTEAAQLYDLDMSYPLVVKGVFYGAHICTGVDEALRAFHEVAARWGFPVIVQEFVPGEEVNVAAVGDGEGGLLGAVAMKKMMLTDKGKGWAGVTIRDPRLLALSAHIIQTLRWRGPCEIEVRKDPDGALHLLEINPRMPAWIDLAAGAGQDLPLTVIRLAAGEALPPLSPYRPGVAFVRASIDQIIDIADLEAMTTAGERQWSQP